jgi:ubiquinone/menaquinone biosynthesis C-methylase UbiE
MIPRTLEPEVMDSPEEARDYDAMDHCAVNRVFAGDFLAVWDGRNPILDVGTGTAQIPIELCRRSQEARVTAIDLAEHMLRVGRQNVERAGFSDRIQLQLCDAKHTPFADGHFAAVISNSIVHHIPEPAHVLAEIVRVVRPGGLLFIRDLLRPDNEAALEHLVTKYAGDANAHQQRMFRESLHAALSLPEIRSLVAGLHFDPETVQQTTDRHWTWTALKKVASD